MLTRSAILGLSVCSWSILIKDVDYASRYRWQARNSRHDYITALNGARTYTITKCAYTLPKSQLVKHISVKQSHSRCRNEDRDPERKTHAGVDCEDTLSRALGPTPAQKVSRPRASITSSTHALTPHPTMVLRIRLSRFGKKHAPFYNIVLTHARTARNSRPLEVLGTYNPVPQPPRPGDTHGRPWKDIKLDVSRARYWVGVGAQPSDTAWRLLSMVC